MRLTIIIPCFNEVSTIEEILRRIKKQTKISKYIILVDDCSTDGTRELIRKKLYKTVNKVIYHKNNKGKGACIKSAKKFIKGDAVLIQDADLEYFPSDYEKLMKNFNSKNSQVVYGSRVIGKSRYSLKNFSSIYRIFFNHILTIVTNVFCHQNLTDAHTCYKLVDKKIFKKIKLQENDFAFCPEITAKISKLGITIKEIPIKYDGRSYEEGKKIKFSDGFRALITIFTYS
tara:strand:+ start:596 stop:1285 length:690 start_codon:yes stop_codon:yes gene_type:complete